MFNKKTIIFISEKDRVGAMNVVKKELSDVGVLGLIVGKKELGNFVINGISDYVFPEGSTARRFITGQQVKATRIGTKPIDIKKVTKLLGDKNPTVKRISNMLSRYNPEAVCVSGYRTLLSLVSAVQKSGKNIKVFVLCDELVLDKRLINNFVDYYFVENFNMKNLLVENGVPEERVEINDFPVDTKYFSMSNQNDMKQKIGVSTEKPTVLINCSGAGSDNKYKKIIDDLCAAAFNVDYIVACEKNKSLITHARAKGLNAFNEGIDMAAAITAADLIISRPSTAFIKEVEAKNKKLLAVLPTGGYEKFNFKFVSTNSLVTAVEESKENLELLSKVRAFLGEYIANDEKAVDAEYAFDERDGSLTLQKNRDNSGNIDKSAARKIAERMAELLINASDVSVKKEVEQVEEESAEV